MSLPLTHAALAQLVAGQLRSGDPAALVTGLNSLSDAVAGEVSFLGNPKYAPQLAKTQATAVLVTEEHSAALEGKALIVVENPTLAFSAVIEHFAVKPRALSAGVHTTAYVAASAKVDPTASIGPLAVIEEEAVIGAGTQIHGGAFIGPGARVGEQCVIHAHATVQHSCVLADRVILHSGAVVGSDGFGYEFAGGKHVKIDQVGIVQIDADVEIGACSTIDRARFGKTHIGQGTKIDNQVQIGHNVVIGKHCILVAHVAIAGSTQLGDYVVAAGQAAVGGHLKIASQVTLLARAGVTKDITEPGHYTGFPAKPLAEGSKLMVYPGMVPKIKEQLKALEKRVSGLEQKS